MLLFPSLMFKEWKQEKIKKTPKKMSLSSHTMIWHESPPPPQTPLKLTEALKGAEQVDTGGASTVGGARVAHTCPNQVRAFQTAAPPLLSAVLHHAALLLRRAKKKARLTRSHRSPKHAHL